MIKEADEDGIFYLKSIVAIFYIGNGIIDFKEFVTMMTKRLKSMNSGG